MRVVAPRSEPIAELNAYLRAAGLDAHARAALRDATTAPLTTCAIVLFPDDYPSNEVARRITFLRATRPSVLVVVVTGAPQLYRPALDHDGHSVVPVVLLKPVFGWAILDAIREHAHSETLE